MRYRYWQSKEANLGSPKMTSASQDSKLYWGRIGTVREEGVKALILLHIGMEIEIIKFESNAHPNAFINWL